MAVDIDDDATVRVPKNVLECNCYGNFEVVVDELDVTNRISA